MSYPTRLYETCNRNSPHALRTFIADVRNSLSDDDDRTIGQIFDHAKSEITAVWELIDIENGRAVYLCDEHADGFMLFVDDQGNPSYETREEAYNPAI